MIVNDKDRKPVIDGWSRRARGLGVAATAHSAPEMGRASPGQP